MIELHTDRLMPPGVPYFCFRGDSGNLWMQAEPGTPYESEVERIEELAPSVSFIARIPRLSYYDGTWHYPDQARRMEKLKKLIAKYPDPGRRVATN